jgi:hypothetical protein
MTRSTKERVDVGIFKSRTSKSDDSDLYRLHYYHKAALARDTGAHAQYLALMRSCIDP